VFDEFSGISRDVARQSGARIVLVATGAAVLAAAVGFAFGWPALTNLWPFMLYGLAPIFVASMLAAIGAPVVWIGSAREFAAIRAGAANILIAAGGIGAYSLWQSWSNPASFMQMFGLANIAVAMLAIFLLGATAREKWIDSRPTPVIVRVAFGSFAAILVAVGVALILRLDVFPWPLDDHSSRVYGFFFLGAAAYFVVGLLRPVWGNAKGQLVGFLAYDLVLIVPFVRLWPAVPSLSLTVYIAVLVASGALAIWFLLLSPKWRFGSVA
jgi:hypothetical protein